MANEAVCIETPTRFGRFTIASGATLPFGTLMYLSGDFTVSATSSTDQPFAGIVWELASTATTTFTTITLALDGVWDIKATAATQTLGVAVAVAGAHLLQTADATDYLNGAFVGCVEEDTSSGSFGRP